MFEECPTLPSRGSVSARGALVLAGCLLLAGCRQDMHQAPRYDPLESSDLFTDGRASRPLVAGTVARGQLREDDALYRGKTNGLLVTEFPVPVTATLMARGRERYDVFCSPCHGRTGVGNGVVVQRGFKPPPSYLDARLVQQPIGYVYDVITNGFGAMPDYASQIPVLDRWAITAYVRALQVAGHATVADVPADHRADLDRKPGAGESAAAAARH